MNSHSAWSNDDELRYIASIGTYGEPVKDVSRYELLKNYFYAMQRRKKWGSLNREKIMPAIYAAMKMAQEIERR